MATTCKCDKCGIVSDYTEPGRPHPCGWLQGHRTDCGGVFRAIRWKNEPCPDTERSPAPCVWTPPSTERTLVCVCGNPNPYPQDGGNQLDGSWRCYQCRLDPARAARFASKAT
jgi:hypothetical protein